MKKTTIIFFLFFLQTAYSQESDTIKLNNILRKYSEFDRTLSIALTTPSQKNTQQLTQAIRNRAKNNFNDSIFVISFIYSNDSIGDAKYNLGMNDSALHYYFICHRIFEKYKLNINDFNYGRMYSNLFNIVSAKSPKAAVPYFFLSIEHGNDNIEDLVALYKDNPIIPEDSIFKLLTILNKNYLNNHHKSIGDIDIMFRYISYMDMHYRTKCYSHKSINYSVVQQNDSILQVMFCSIINNVDGFSVFDGSFYQKTFGILLIHSVTTPNTIFFDNYFHRYANELLNNFRDFNLLKSNLDLYLKFKYKKQYFGTVFGQGSLPDNKWGLLPKISEEELKKEFEYLKVINPIY